MTVLEDAAQTPAYRLVQDAAIEKSGRRWPRLGTGWATRPRFLDPRASHVPTADARDGRRGNQPWSVITTPVSA
jgi:hypothetical protein